MAALRGLLVPEGLEAFNAASLWGEETTGGEIVSMAEMLPMAATKEQRRFVLVRRADRLREADAEALAAYAGRPAPTCCLLLVCDHGKSPVAGALKKGSVTLLDFPAPRDYQLARWLEAQARRLGIVLDAGAARVLAQGFGEDFVGAVSTLQRAALSAGGARPKVTRAMIEQLDARDHDANRFHLADAILGREPARAVTILRNLDQAGDSGYALLGLIESQLRKFLEMRGEMASGRPAAMAVQQKSPTLPPDVRARLARQLESFDESRLMEAFRIARRADRALKGHGSGNALAHMEDLVWRVTAL